MDAMLSQEEIQALLDGSSENINITNEEEILTETEKDAIGEIANISMGTAATTLFSLVNRKVDISTPVVTVVAWEDLVEAYERPCVFIRIAYTVGLNGCNILVLKENDVKVITDLMMGGDGTNTDGALGELHLSAISEAMNQMMGSSATSMSSMLNKTIDISPPEASLIDLKETINENEIADFLGSRFVRIAFRMVIDGLVDSEIMQLYSPEFVKEMYQNVTNTMGQSNSSPVNTTAPKKAEKPVQKAQPQMTPQQPMQNNPQMMGEMNPQMMNPQMMNPQMMNPQMMNPQMMMPYGYEQQAINVQQAQFQPFSAGLGEYAQKENIDLILDVPLEVTVELGRTTKSIQDILDFAPGTIIELNKIAGEPIDVLVNGKYVAKGEVVVIEESFGVRITEIINA